MSDDRLQHELDDELLSAYLDDELSADERAAVETRLSRDPAARQLLEELRHASQALRGLPHATLGYDLHDSIVRRGAATKSAAATAVPEPEDARTLGPLPKITVGRTLRAWVWASLAVAAGLLIMVFQPETPDDARLPAVAQRDRTPAELRAAPGSAPEGAVSAAGESSNVDAFALSSREDESSVSELAAAPSAPASAPPASSSNLSGGRAFGTASPESQPAEPAASPPEDTDERFVIVHVLAKPEALKDKTFDRLLAANGIAVEPPTSGEGRDVSSALREERSPRRSLAQAPPEQKTSEGTGVDLVLVEAPTPAIVSCLSALNEDSENYLGVAVEDSAASDDLSSIRTKLSKKPAADFGKYNRGVVPQLESESLSGDRTYFYQPQESARRYSGALGGRAGTTSGVQFDERQSPARGSQMLNLGRARRVQPSTEINGQIEERLGFADRAAIQQRLSPQQRQRQKSRADDKQLTDAAGDELQVLFVLRPGNEPAPSPAAENRPE